LEAKTGGEERETASPESQSRFWELAKRIYASRKSGKETAKRFWGWGKKETG
jgi:hypothetical protein